MLIEELRPANLDDTAAICALFCARVEKWQRMNTLGQVEDLPYESLNVYERWLHGGPWLSVETAAIWLSHLLRCGARPLVAAVRGRPAAYAELYPGHEPPPFGEYLHLAHIVAHPDYGGPELGDRLLQTLLEQAAPVRLTAACPAYDSEQSAFYLRHGLGPVERVQRCRIRAQTGQSFYRAVEDPDPAADKIRGWLMPVGRLTSGRSQWEMLWPALWHGVPQLLQQRTHRLHITAAAQEAYLCVQQQLYDPRSADVYCWTPKPLSSQLLVAVRDWAHREGYRTLVMTVNEQVAKLLGPEAEPDPYMQDVYISR